MFWYLTIFSRRWDSTKRLIFNLKQLASTTIIYKNLHQSILGLPVVSISLGAAAFAAFGLFWPIQTIIGSLILQTPRLSYESIDPSMISVRPSILTITAPKPTIWFTICETYPLSIDWLCQLVHHAIHQILLCTKFNGDKLVLTVIRSEVQLLRSRRPLMDFSLPHNWIGKIYLRLREYWQPLRNLPMIRHSLWRRKHYFAHGKEPGSGTEGPQKHYSW